MNKGAFFSLFAMAFLLAFGLRLGRLDLRPMHHDEANQAVKFGALLEHGEYRYDPADHHGPTLYYLTLPAAWARGQKSLAQLDEWTVRIVPALFGAALILLFAFLADGLGREAVLLAALFAALSPAMTYFSRFYIQEALFAFFSLGFALALGHYVTRPGLGAAVIAGVCGGMAFATKETSIIIFAASGAALALSAPAKKSFKPGHILLGTAAGAAAAVVLLSSFFTNPAGIVDSIRAFKDYAVRATANGPHAHPWHYYFTLLGFSSSGGLIWSEGLILILGLGGVILVFARAREFWPRYIAYYTLITAASLSVIPLKAPWDLLPFYAGMILLAGFGAAALLRAPKSGWFRGAGALALLAGCWHLGLQDWKANYRYPADPRNPYVYAQTTPDFLRLVDRIHSLAAVHENGRDMPVKVIAGPYEQWPLPWYLRDLRRVGYWTDVSSAGEFGGVAVVIASQENAAALDSALGDRFQAEFYGLRPGVLLTVYIERALWLRFLGVSDKSD